MHLPTFNNPSLLLRALTHRSYVNEHPDAGEDNQRLEFLGDAVLDFIVGSVLYHRHPELHEGGLTQLRAALVKMPQLAVFANELGLGPMMRLGRGEDENGGRGRGPLLADSFEAVLGAYYIDSGLAAVQNFLDPLIARYADEIIRAQGEVDAKSLFQEYAQSKLGTTPRYNTVSVSGPDHKREFTVEVTVAGVSYGIGSGPNKQAAAQNAARAALASVELA